MEFQAVLPNKRFHPVALFVDSGREKGDGFARFFFLLFSFFGGNPGSGSPRTKNRMAKVLSEWLKNVKQTGSSGWPNKMMTREEFLAVLPRPAADGKGRNKQAAPLRVLKRQYTMLDLISLNFCQWVDEYRRLDTEPSLTRAEFDELSKSLARKK